MKPKSFDKKKGYQQVPLIVIWNHGSMDTGRLIVETICVTLQGDMVYPAAALGIVSNKREQRFFNLHTDDVISLAGTHKGKLSRW